MISIPTKSDNKETISESDIGEREREMESTDKRQRGKIITTSRMIRRGQPLSGDDEDSFNTYFKDASNKPSKAM